jgi:cytochrome bd-type quinol oxidase subunit 2
MLSGLIQSFHVLCAVTLAGGIAGSYFYQTMAMKKQYADIANYTQKSAWLFYWMVLFPLLLITSATGAIVAKNEHLTTQVPWIATAILGVHLLLIISIATYLLKRYFNQCIKLWHILNCLMLLLLFVIIHDAVLQKTLFNWNGAVKLFH